MFSSYERIVCVFDPEIQTANRQNMETQQTETTLWSDFPLENASQGETVEGLHTDSDFFRRPDTEEVQGLYAFRTGMSNVPFGRYSISLRRRSLPRSDPSDRVVLAILPS
jgi:hypothetical protein